MITWRKAVSDPGNLDAQHIAMLLIPAEKEVAVYPVEPGEAFLALVNLIETGHVLIYEEDGVVIGSIGLDRTRYWYNRSYWFWYDMWVYVRHDMRGLPMLKAISQSLQEIANANQEGIQLTLAPPTMAGKKGGFGNLHRVGAAYHVRPMP